MTRVAISGAIAVGKTTLATGLRDIEPSWHVATEAVGQHRFLERFYGNPQRWAFHSRIEFLALKSQQLLIEGSAGSDVQLFDRTVHELITFASVMHQSLTLSPDEFELYERLYGVLLATLPPIDATLWLYADSEVCLRRIRDRARTFEQGIGIPYLESLQAAYALWFEQLEGPKLAIDSSEDNWWDNKFPEVVDWIRASAG
jgi:deoxyguanosine kinase